jgi:multidrug resistance efflux pump
MKVANINFRATALAWILAGLCLQGCKPSKEAPTSSEDPPRVIHGVGYLEPRGRLRRLAFQGSGVIGKIEFGIGDPVKAGDVVARLDDRIEASQLAAAEARLAVVEAKRDLTHAGAHPDAIKAAEAKHQAAEVEMAFRRSERMRLEALRDKRSISGVDMDTAAFADRLSAAYSEVSGSELAKLKNQVRAEDRALLEAEAASAKAEVQAARAAVQTMVMHAPADGTVIEIFRYEGESVSSAPSEPVILFAPAGPLEIRAEVDEQFANHVRVGDKAKIRPRGDETEKNGVVREIKKVMGRKSVFTQSATERMDLQILEVRIEMAEAPPWPIGMEVDVEIAQ